MENISKTYDLSEFEKTNLSISIIVSILFGILLLFFLCTFCICELNHHIHVCNENYTPEGVLCYCKNGSCNKCDSEEFEDWVGLLTLRECCFNFFKSGFSSDCYDDFSNFFFSTLHCSLCCRINNFIPPNQTNFISKLRNKFIAYESLPPGVIPSILDQKIKNLL